jgi:hypothetical protein
MVVKTVPVVVISSMKIGEVTPKLPSTVSLFQTLLVVVREGNKPLLVALPVPHAAVLGQSGGKASPMVTVDAVPVYKLRVKTRLSGVKTGLVPTDVAKTGTVVAQNAKAAYLSMFQDDGVKWFLQD